MKSSRTIVLAVLFALITGYCSLVTEAAPPQLINFQGRLVNGTNLVSGQLSVVLRVYTNETSGSYLFEDSNDVTVVDGLYSVQLGAHPLSGTLTNALATGSAWIEVEVNGTILSPREQILSVGYALNTRESDPLWSDASTNVVRKTGDTMTGPLNITVMGGTNGVLITSSASNVTIGLNADGRSQGVAVGFRANANSGGVALGYMATGTSYGVAVGYQANGMGGLAIGTFANGEMGAAVGYGANASQDAVALGDNANAYREGTAIGDTTDARWYGVALGFTAKAYWYGVAAGTMANANYYGIGIGAEANGSQTNIAIGYLAETKNGSERIAIGHGVTNQINNSAALRGTLYLDGGTGVYYRSTFGSGGWVSLLAGLATGTPLYAFTETDPVFSASAASAISAVQTSQWSQAYGWGNHAAATAALWSAVATKLDSNTWAAANSTTNYVRRTGDTMTGILTVQTNVNFNYNVDRGWGPRDMLTIGGGSSVEIGNGANGYYFGSAVGYAANGFNYGAAMGKDANAYDSGAAFGERAIGASSGAVVGCLGNGFDGGVAVGLVANGANKGVALGYMAIGASTNVAIGYDATANRGSERIAIGHNVNNQIDDSAAVRGTLFLDGGSNVYFRTNFGSGAWSDLIAEKVGGDTNFVRKTGDTMTGALSVNVGADNDLVVDSGGRGVMVGQSADGTATGAAVGAFALGYDEGAAVGWGSRGAVRGAGVGFQAYGSSEGAALGYKANGEGQSAAVGYEAYAFPGGAAVGYQADGGDSGVAVGYHARGPNGNVAVGNSSFATGANQIAIGHGVTNENDNSIAVRGNLYIDGGTKIYYRNAFGMGAFSDILLPYAETVEVEALSNTVYSSNFATNYVRRTGDTMTGMLTVSSALEQGLNAMAHGPYSHAEGIAAEAFGLGSHAEGFATKSYVDGSHAEGTQTIVSNAFAHAEGELSRAEGVASHAEGKSTVTTNSYAHAEGLGSQAGGDASHAEGEYTRTHGIRSHAEGVNTVAHGPYSHAEGIAAEAFGLGSHAEGFATKSYVDGSHAEGTQTIASNAFAHAEGVSTLAEGYGSHAEGERSRAGGRVSHADGYRSQAIHSNTFVWADGTDADFASVTNDEFAIRAAHGLRLVGGSFIGNGSGLTNITAAYYAETDPAFSASVASAISAAQTGQWSQAYSWGDHAAATAALWSAVATKLDSNTWAAADSTTNYVRRTGDTMTGDLNINAPAGLAIGSTNSNVIIGRKAGAGSTGVAIGNNATGLTISVAIGNNSAASSGGVAIGGSASAAFGVAVGPSASAPDHGVAVGESAGASHGVAVGAYAGGSSFGTAIGESADGSSSGAAVGRVANGSSGGAVVGHSANGYNYGAAVGYSAFGYEYGAALGDGANAINGGVAIGYSAYGVSTNIAIGYQANAGGFGATNRIAIGRGVINSNNNSAVIRGTLFLDGGTGIYYRTGFGSGAWGNLLADQIETEVVPYEFGMATNNSWRNNTGGADYEWDNLNLGLNAYDHGTSGVVTLKIRVFAFCDGATNLWVGVRNNTDSTYPIAHTQTAGLNNTTPTWWESGWTTVTNTTGIKELRVSSYTDESSKYYFIKKAILLVKYQKKLGD